MKAWAALFTLRITTCHSSLQHMINELLCSDVSLNRQGSSVLSQTLIARTTPLIDRTYLRLVNEWFRETE